MRKTIGLVLLVLSLPACTPDKGATSTSRDKGATSTSSEDRHAEDEELYGT
jgi:hypothetical protein